MVVRNDAAMMTNITYTVIEQLAKLQSVISFPCNCKPHYEINRILSSLAVDVAQLP